MKIGFVSREYPPFFGGGVGTYVDQASRALASLGHDVHVFTMGAGQGYADGDPPGVFVHRLRYAPPDPFTKGLAGAWTRANEWLYAAGLFYRALMEFTEKQRLDIVEFPEWEAPGWMLLLDPRWAVPSVVRCHTPTWLLQELNGQSPLRGQDLELLQLALADGVCAPCTPMAERTGSAVELARPIEMLPYPYAADEVTTRFEAPQGKRVLYVGRLEARKGVEELIRAAPEVLNAEPEAHLVLVGGDTPTAPGGGSMKEHLVSLLGNEHLPRVRFVDNIPGDRLVQYYRSSLFCVFPSRFENFPNVCLEAMALGRTAVVGSDSGMVEMTGDSAVPVAPGDPAGLARAMVGLLRDPARCVQLGEAAYRRVRAAFEPAAIARRQAAYFRSVIETAGTRVSLGDRVARVKPGVWQKAAPELATALTALHGRAHEPEDTALPREVERLIERLAPCRGIRRFALYGAGRHTQKIVPYLPRLSDRGIEVKLILDDDEARQGTRIAGLAVVAPVEALAFELEGVVLSSDAMESRLWEKSRPLRAAGLPVYRLYGPPSGEG